MKVDYREKVMFVPCTNDVVASIVTALSARRRGGVAAAEQHLDITGCCC